MKGKFSNYYRKAGGTTVFVYHVTGTEAELNAYKAAQGSNLRTENPDGTGAPLFFSTRPLSESKNTEVKLVVTANGRVVADDADRVFAQEVKLDDYVMKEKAKIIAMKALGGGSALDMLTAAISSRPIDNTVDIPANVAAPVNVAQDIPA